MGMSAETINPSRRGFIASRMDVARWSPSRSRTPTVRSPSLTGNWSNSGLFTASHAAAFSCAGAHTNSGANVPMSRTWKLPSMACSAVSSSASSTLTAAPDACTSLGDNSRRFSSPRQQVGEVVVDAGHPEIRLALERPPQIVNAVRVAAPKLHDGKDEVARLVQAIQNLVLRHGDRIRAGHSAFHLDE